MRRIIRGAFGFVLAVAVVVGGCTEQGSPVGLAPRGEASLDIFGTSSDGSLATASDTTAVGGAAAAVDLSVKIVPRDVPLASSVQVTKSVGVEGGKIDLPEAGLKLYIPSGALNQATTITVTALAGKGVAYDFQPHGLAFNKPLVAVQAFKLDGSSVPAVQGGYFADNTQLDLANLTGRIKEREPTEVKLSEKKIKFNIPHFSGYLLSID